MCCCQIGKTEKARAVDIYTHAFGEDPRRRKARWNRAASHGRFPRHCPHFARRRASVTTGGKMESDQREKKTNIVHYGSGVGACRVMRSFSTLCACDLSRSRSSLSLSSPSLFMRSFSASLRCLCMSSAASRMDDLRSVHWDLNTRGFHGMVCLNCSPPQMRHSCRAM